MLLTAGTVADGTQALALIEGIPAEYLLADKSLPRTRYGGYDTNRIVAQATELGMQVVIPSRRNRREQREYDRHLYQLRHLVENGFAISSPPEADVGWRHATPGKRLRSWPTARSAPSRSGSR